MQAVRLFEVSRFDVWATPVRRLVSMRNLKMILCNLNASFYHVEFKEYPELDVII